MKRKLAYSTLALLTPLDKHELEYGLSWYNFAFSGMMV